MTIFFTLAIFIFYVFIEDSLAPELSVSLLLPNGLTSARGLPLTNLDPWGPTQAQMQEICDACTGYEDRRLVMRALWKRITTPGGHRVAFFCAVYSCFALTTRPCCWHPPPCLKCIYLSMTREYSCPHFKYCVVCVPCFQKKKKGGVHHLNSTTLLNTQHKGPPYGLCH